MRFRNEDQNGHVRSSCKSFSTRFVCQVAVTVTCQFAVCIWAHPCIKSINLFTCSRFAVVTDNCKISVGDRLEVSLGALVFTSAALQTAPYKMSACCCCHPYRDLFQFIHCRRLSFRPGLRHWDAADNVGQQKSRQCIVGFIATHKSR